MDRIDTELAQRLAEEVRNACLQAAMTGYEDGGLSGLCAEGRWDLAVDAMRSLDVERVVTKLLGKPR